jgi:hypothetical protein
LEVESMATAQAGIDAWAHADDHGRPHPALEMGTPVSPFGPTPTSEPGFA